MPALVIDLLYQSVSMSLHLASRVYHSGIIQTHAETPERPKDPPTATREALANPQTPSCRQHRQTSCPSLRDTALLQPIHQPLGLSHLHTAHRLALLRLIFTAAKRFLRGLQPNIPVIEVGLIRLLEGEWVECNVLRLL